MEENDNKDPIGILFGTLAYYTLEEYEQYLERLNNLNSKDIYVTIFHSLKYAQKAGVFNLEETEAISVTTRKLSKLISEN